MTCSGRELVHLKVSKLTWRHVGSWARSSFVANGLEPFDSVSRWLVHYGAASILESAGKISSNLTLALVVRWIIGAWWRGAVSFFWSEPLLTWRPIGTSRILNG